MLCIYIFIYNVIVQTFALTLLKTDHKNNFVWNYTVHKDKEILHRM